MAKKKQTQKQYTHAPPVIKTVSETLQSNYMPYVMSVIMSRAIPEIDGLKPSHRKLLYTMYTMGLLRSSRQKSANIVGTTMRLNPHGEQAIYETMVRLARGYEAMPHPFIDSKGNFGKHYSRDMAYAASRYTEARLAPICHALFDDIDMETVDFFPNYDNSMKEPALLPVSFPTILTTPNQGIAVGMASNICSFNLREVCDTVIAYIADPSHHINSTLPAPDFSTGGQILMNASAIDEIYSTGRGTVRIRAKYEIEKGGIIRITEIPYTTTVEAIIDKIVELVKSSKIKDISDVKDMSDLKGLSITIEPKRGADPERIMARLFKMTPLEDSFGCNFNILTGASVQVMGIKEIIDEWLAFRIECVRRRTFFAMTKAKSRLHLLCGLKKILLDIDKAIKIVRESESDDEVVPNLMIGFGIDEVQAEFIANIRLRHLNRDYILKRLSDIDDLEKEIAAHELTLKNKSRINKIIVSELKLAKEKYGIDRKSELVYEDEISELDPEEHIDDYPVTLFLTKESYFKKITPLSLRMGGAHTFKDGDEIRQQIDTTNKAQLIFFTTKQNAYKIKAYEFADSKASVLGEFLPSRLGMEADETVVAMAATCDYSGYMVFFFENGKAAKVPLNSYQTLTNRKRLIAAYNAKSPLVTASFIEADCEFALYSSNNKVLIASTAFVAPKSSKSTVGVSVMVQKGKNALAKVLPLEKSGIINEDYYRTKNIPAVGHFLREKDLADDQISLIP